MSISYGGESCEASSWAGFAVSEGLWCAVAYPDGTSTQVGYVDGRIGMIVDAGGVGVGLGWDAAGRLARVRGVASTMAAATDAAWRVDATAAVIDYDQYGRVQSVTAPATRPDAARLRHTYTYPTGQSQPLRAQVAEDVVQGGSATLTDTALGRGVVSAVEARSDTWQIIKSTGGDGLVSSMSYNPASGALSSGTAANGRATTMNSDAEGLVSSTVGPFLASPAGALTTARTLDATVLDPTNPTASTTRAWEGLAAVVWGEGAVGGSPQWWNRSILGDGLGASFSGSPLGGTAPWRAQATGLWRIAESGKYRIGINASGRTGVDLTIDGSRCVDDSGAAGCTLPLSKGEHFVTLSISANRPDGSAAFAVTASGQGRSGRIAIADLRPNYNVATRTVTNDIVGGSNLATRVMDFAQPWTGSPSSVTAAGGLTTRIRYEGTNATTGAFGRPLEMTTPGGATQQMTYFGVGESVTDPCTGTSLPQSGQRRSTTRYDRVVEASVYDGAGRVVSTTTTGDGVSEVACFAYDAAGRLIASSITGIDGALREKSSISHTMAGGRLTQTTTITLGDGAPVRAGETFVSVVVMDTAGQVLESTEANGTRTAWEYDVDGSPVRRTVWAPGAQQPTLDVVSVYDSLTGWLSSVEANGTVLARVTYDRYGLPSSIAYASGVQAAVAYDTAGSTKELRLAAGAQQISQTRTRNAAGRTTAVSTTVTGAGQSSYDWRYTYDSAGRLTAAALRASGRSEITGGTARAMEYTYGAAPSGCAAGAAADLERTGGSRDGTTYQTCRDERGRLKWTTDPHLAESGQRAEATYDALGRLTSLSGRVPLTQTWLHGTQVAAITEGSTDADRVTTTLLTVGGVLLERTYADASGSTVTRYGYGGSTTPSLLLDDKGAVTDIRVDLPGGALAHLTPQQSISVEHADLYGAALAVSRDGAFVGDGISSALGPFGEPLGEQAATGPTSGIGTGTAFTFHAGPRNATLAGHHSITLTARPYHPWLGEFLAFDPEVGASTTGYGYGDGNPVDKPDFSGGEGLWDLIGVAGGILAAVGGVATGNINVRTSSLAKVAAGAALAVGTAAAVTGVVMSWKTSDSTASSAFTTAIAAVGLVIAGHAVGSKILSERENNRLLRQYVGQAQGLAEIDAQVADFKRAMEQRRLDLYKPNMNINQMQVAMDSFNQAKEAYEEALLDRTYYHFVSVSNKGPQSFKDWWSGYDLLNTKFVPAG
jgi:YD repeat-containing protein